MSGVISFNFDLIVPHGKLTFGQNVEGDSAPTTTATTAATLMLHSGANAATLGDIFAHWKQFMTLVYSYPSRNRGTEPSRGRRESGAGSTNSRRPFAGAVLNGKVCSKMWEVAGF